MSASGPLKKIIAIARKDLLIRFSSPSEWLFFLVLPIVFTVVLAGGTGASGDNRIRLVVVDQAQSPLSTELIAGLDQSQAVRADVQTASQADKLFSQRQVSAALYIPAGFDLEHLRSGKLELDLHQQPNAPNALVDYQAVSAVISRISSSVDIANGSLAVAEGIQPFASQSARNAYFDAALKAAQVQLGQAPDRLAIVRGSTPDPIKYDPRANSSAGQLITWVFIPLIGISSLFAYERQKGTLRRLLTSPTEKATFLLGTITGQVLIALVQMLLLVGFGILVMKINWGGNLPGLAVMLVASALAAAALGTALGAFVKTEGQANGLSILFGMVMALLGGCWYPIELFPQFVRT
ncbi:MAG: ABC transporter permease, partial [Anaerolineaceae bacterium]|nr:ABC transporter permease [Anaerolineaceae bacterium]